jgi:hypothetical protein
MLSMKLASFGNCEDFFRRSLLHLRMGRPQISGPRKRQRRRFMAGEEEGQHLIVKLLVWHGIAIGITCGEERAEKVMPSFAGIPPGLDDCS